MLGSNNLSMFMFVLFWCIWIKIQFFYLLIQKPIFFYLHMYSYRELNSDLRNYNYGHLYCFPAKSLKWHLSGILIKISDRLFGVVSWKMQTIEREWIACVFWGSCEGKRFAFDGHTKAEPNKWSGDGNTVCYSAGARVTSPVPPVKQLSWH